MPQTCELFSFIVIWKIKEARVSLLPFNINAVPGDREKHSLWPNVLAISVIKQILKLRKAALSQKA